MDLSDAIDLVLSLARLEILDEKDVQGDPVLESVRIKQITAVDTVEDFFVNNVFDD